MNSSLPQRISPRADFIDYSAGDFFITICTRNKNKYFGDIHNDIMFLSQIGKFCDDEFGKISTHYPYVVVREHIVMPNHVHAILTVDGESYLRFHPEAQLPQQRDLLAVVVGGFKAAITRYSNRNRIEFAWQERFHDHVIRNHHDGNNIARYIKTNVQRWSSDCFHPGPKRG